MYSRKYKTRKTSSQSSETPASNPLELHRFVVQPRPHTPDLQAQEDKLTQSNSSLTNISIFRPGYQPLPPPRIQAKLTIGQVGDKFEQEADRVAADVVQRINAPQSFQVQRQELVQDEEKLQMKSLTGAIQRQETPEDELQMKPMVQRQSVAGGMAATPNLEESIQGLKGSGQPLTKSIREPMEQAFGADFSGVKVHTNAQSDQMNQSIQAKAFTTGQDIFFRQGAYNPESRDGQHLLAHELTHVVQQRASQVVMPQIERVSTNTTYTETDVMSRKNSKSENLADKIQCQELQTGTDVIQRVSVKAAIAMFDEIASKNAEDINRQKQQKGGASKGSPAASKSVKADAEQKQSEPQLSDLQPVEAKKAEESETLAPPSTSSDLKKEETANKDDQRKKQVEKNVNLISDTMFKMYEDGNAKDENTETRQNFAEEYTKVIKLARTLLPDLLLAREQNGEASYLLTDSEVESFVQEIGDKLGSGEVPKVEEPKKTGKERWNKLAKIVKTDANTRQIIGKSKTLTYVDIIDNIRKNDLDDLRSYWLEAWDALHRPAFNLVGDSQEKGSFEEWLEETQILDWLDDQEKRDKEMMVAFEKQKNEGGETDFWKWKATSEYAQKSSPPPDTISFWEWLEKHNEVLGSKNPQTGQLVDYAGRPIKDLKGGDARVDYLESEVDRRSREVKISGGAWKDAFGGVVDSSDLLAISPDLPNGGKGWMIFVLSPDGKFYAAGHKEGEYHHSSALAGIPIKGAGAIKVTNGRLEAIADKSGHYKPNMHQMYTTLTQLQKAGVDLASIDVITRDFGDLKGDEWMEKYLNSEQRKDYLKTDAANAFKISGRDNRQKKDK
ncbi:MAG TPA: DUF4157 domain-containing protein [Trichormus sp. M33_DOE_039]|nr:DUF4157 domain-containing protein [Trichormus sp. M33_DOE_039]